MSLRAFLTDYIDHRIVVHTVHSWHDRRDQSSLIGTVLAVDDTLVRLRTTQGDQHVAIDHIVEFRPIDSTKLPAAVSHVRDQPTKTIVLEQFAALEKALAAREPEAKVRVLLGRVIHGATAVLAARGDDRELAVARERCEFILKKCSDPTLPEDEG